MNSSLSADVELEIPFYDVDMLRIVWHGHYTKYFERARCALLDRIDFGYLAMERSGFQWPVVDCRLKFIRPARFGMRIRVSATLTEYEHRLGVRYLIADADSGERLTKGSTLQVAVDVASGELQYVSPPILREKVECALRSR